MARSGRGEPPPPSDPEQGIWQGRSIARRFVSAEGFTVLVGRTAADNDLLTFKLGKPRDFWLHVAGEPGSHVVVRNPDGVERLPKETERFAAALAAAHSKAKKGGWVSVHLARCEDISKPRGLPPGKVVLERYRSVEAKPYVAEGEGG